VSIKTPCIIVRDARNKRWQVQRVSDGVILANAPTRASAQRSVDYFEGRRS